MTVDADTIANLAITRYIRRGRSGWALVSYSARDNGLNRRHEGWVRTSIFGFGNRTDLLKSKDMHETILAHIRLRDKHIEDWSET